MKLNITAILVAILMFVSTNIFAHQNKPKQSGTLVVSCEIESSAISQPEILAQDFDGASTDFNFPTNYSDFKILDFPKGKPNRTTKRNLMYNKPYLVSIVFYNPPNGDFSVLVT